MKKILITILVLWLSFFNINDAFAANTHSIDLELSSSQYLSKTDSASLSITGDLTLECWIKLEQLPSTAGSHMEFLTKHDYVSAENDNRSWAWSLRSDDKVRLDFRDQSHNLTNKISNAVFVDVDDVGVWVHIAAVVDVSVPTITFYKNASPITSTFANTNATSIGDFTSSFRIGAIHYSGIIEYFDGKIDEARVWDDIRTATEISDNKDQELVGNEANLQGYWKLNNDLLDETANDNDLTNNNSAVFSTDVPFAGEAEDTCTPTLDGVWRMDLQDYCTTTVSTYSDYGMECYNPVGGSWVIANGVEVRRGNSTNCLPQLEGTGVFSIQPIH